MTTTTNRPRVDNPNVGKNYKPADPTNKPRVDDQTVGKDYKPKGGGGSSNIRVDNPNVGKDYQGDAVLPGQQSTPQNPAPIEQTRNLTAAEKAQLQSGQSQLIDPVTGRAYKAQPGNLLVAVRTQEEVRDYRNRQVQKMAAQGEANYQDTKGNVYNIEKQSPQYENGSQKNISVFSSSNNNNSFINETTRESRIISGDSSLDNNNIQNNFVDTKEDKELKVFSIIPTGIKESSINPYQKFSAAAREPNTGFISTTTEGFLAVSTGVFEGAVAYPVFYTKETLVGIKNLFVHPIESAKSLKEQFIESPEGTTGTILGGMLLSKGVSTATPASVKDVIPRPTYDTIDIPQTGGGSATVSSVGVRAGSKSVVAGSKVVSDGSASYSVGRPNIQNILQGIPEGTDVKIGGALQTNIIEKNLRTMDAATERAQQAIPVAQNILGKTRFTNAKTGANIILETERLPPEGVQVILDIAKKEEATVFGSFARRQTSDAFSTPRDIDVRLVDASPEVVNRVTKETISGLEQKGIIARERVDTPGAVEVKQPGGTWEKAVEFKGKELGAGEEAVPEFVLGFKKEGTPIKIAGQKFTGLNEESRGVMQGVIRLRTVDGVVDLYPPPKRVKDIQSVITSAEVLQKNQLIERPGLARDIQKFKELYQSETTSITPQSESVLLVDYSPSSGARSPMSRVPIISSRSAAMNERSPNNVLAEDPSIVSPTNSPASPSISPVAIQSPSPYLRTTPSPSTISPTTDSSPSRSSSPNKSPSSSPSSSPVVDYSPSPSPPSPSPNGSPSPSPSSSYNGSTSIIPPITIPTTEKKYIFPVPRTQQNKTEPLFDVEVRRDGRFVPFSTQGMRLSEAVDYVEKFVDTTAKASFKVVYHNTRSPVQGEDREAVWKLLKPDRYRESKMNTDVFVEKNKYRINTPGEKTEIRPKKGMFDTTKGGRSIWV